MSAGVRFQTIFTKARTSESESVFMLKLLTFLSLVGLTAASHSCDIAGQVRHRSLDSRIRSLTYSLPCLRAHTHDAGAAEGADREVPLISTHNNPTPY